MKKSIVIPIMLWSIVAFSQTPSTIKVDLDAKTNKISVVPEDLTKVKLPVVFSFSESFKNSEVKMLDLKSNMRVAPAVKKFGDDALQKDGDDGRYHIRIAVDRSVNPGENDKVNADSIKIETQAGVLKIAFDNSGNQPDGGGGSTGEKDYQAGYVYYDVFTLLDKKISPAIRKKILATYGIKTAEDLSKNVYLKYVAILSLPEAEAQGGESFSLLSSLGGIDVTYFAAGLARFLAERAKDEINEAFFAKMKRQLNAYPELKTAFPKTVVILNSIETYAYSSVLQVLKEAFEADMQTITDNLYNIKNLTKADCKKKLICEKEEECKKFKECEERISVLETFFATQKGRWTGLGMYSINQISKSANPAEFIKDVATSAEFSSLKASSEANKAYGDYNIVSSLELSNFISQSLISKDSSQVWVTTTQLTQLIKTNDAFKVYLGLLLAKQRIENPKIDFKDLTGKPTSFEKILNDHAANYQDFEVLIKNVHTSFNAANNAVKKIAAAVEKSVSAEPQVLYDYYKTFTSALQQVAHNKLLCYLVKADIGSAFDQVEKYLNPSVDIAYHLATKKYSAAIYDAFILLSNLNEAANAKGKYVYKPVTKDFIKYGTLVSTMATAQSSEEVKKALEASVLPAGSYSIKRNTSWSISVNSYVGAFWNYTGANKEYQPALGLSAPVGLNISKGFSKTGNGGSIGLNLQVIDVGALVNYYLLKGDTAAIPNDFKVRLSNIFAPGFNLAYNIPKVPISIAWGGQYIPTLYKVEQIAGKNELVPANAWRWQLSVLVDIPLFNLKVWDFR